jgi:selenocysteine lyase/cysteine desulfurase
MLLLCLLFITHQTNNIMTIEDVKRLRAETKGCTQTIHFNNAGAALPPDKVVDTVVSYLHEEAVKGGYETEAKYREQLANTYNLIAELINASPGEVAVVENASVGWWTAFNGVDLKEGDEIITCEMEYVTNVLGFFAAEKLRGVTIKVIPNDEQGNFCLQALEDAITPKTRLIAATHVGSTAGGVIPVEDIGAIAHKHNILYLVDACQSIGHLPVDVKKINCDMLAVTGRKYLRAPRGTGFLYVKKAVQDSLKLMYMDGFSAPNVTSNGYLTRNDARRFELYEKNRALTLGLAKAVEYALNTGIDKIWQRIQYLAAIMRRQLGSIAGVTVHDIGRQQCGIVTFSVTGTSSFVVKEKLAEKNINVLVGKAHSTIYYMQKHNLKNIVRASIHYYNTEEEITALCDALTDITGNNK